jgi:hypothetical protein
MGCGFSDAPGVRNLSYKPAEPSAEDVKLRHAIDQIYTGHPVYGSRRIAVELRRQGWDVNRKRVQRCMRETGIEGICPPHLRCQRSALTPWSASLLELQHRVRGDRPIRRRFVTEKIRIVIAITKNNW